MTQFLEKVALALDKAIQDDKYCGQEKISGPAKTCVIDGISGTGDAAVLRDNMIAAKVVDPVSSGRPRKLDGAWDLHDCDNYHFPYQSHHLVARHGGHGSFG